jgi:thymidylate synthase ThyX
MKSAHGTISADSLSVDINVRSFSDYQVSRNCMAQISERRTASIRERIGCNSEKRFNNPSYLERNCNKERRTVIGIA